MHPFSVAETVRTELSRAEISPQSNPSKANWQALWEHGGFPEPFIRRDRRFSLRWQKLRSVQLIREDLRDLTGIRDLDQLAILLKLLGERSGDQVIYSNLARDIRVSENTVRNWVATLSSLQYGFLVRPWYRNLTKAIRKEPKWFLRDWSQIRDPGRRAETFVACHLLKAVHGWSDFGLGDFDLRYVRDKQKREVDFIVLKDDQPWFLVEVKYRDETLSPALSYFQKATSAKHAFQVVMEADFVDTDCFRYQRPTVVPARTFLSQLI
jgi:predicted AAA+ superfamily ATPase